MSVVIGLIPGSFKPFTKGHMLLIDTAAKECNRVLVLASLSDRARKGEFVIRGEDMKAIWERYIKPILPENVEVAYVPTPIRTAWEILGNADLDRSTNLFSVYGDDADVNARFGEAAQAKYTPYLHANGGILLRPVARKLTDGVSGTRMREALATGDEETFVNGLPEDINGRAIWSLLRKSV